MTLSAAGAGALQIFIEQAFAPGSASLRGEGSAYNRLAMSVALCMPFLLLDNLQSDILQNLVLASAPFATNNLLLSYG